MFGRLVFLALLIVPIIEIGIFLQVGQSIGLLATLGLCLATAFIGMALIRHQGMSILARAQSQMQANAVPAREVFDGLCLFMAGAFLMTPGFFTDSFGFLLLVPGLRRIMMAGLWDALKANLTIITPGGHRQPGQSYRPSDDIIEGEFHEVGSEKERSTPCEGDAAHATSAHISRPDERTSP